MTTMPPRWRRSDDNGRSRAIHGHAAITIRGHTAVRGVRSGGDCHSGRGGHRHSGHSCHGRGVVAVPGEHSAHGRSGIVVTRSGVDGLGETGDASGGAWNHGGDGERHGWS